MKSPFLPQFSLLLKTCFCLGAFTFVASGYSQESDGGLEAELALLESEGESLERLVSIARLHQEAGDLESAARYWHLASKRDDATPETVGGLVAIYLMAGKAEGAALIVKESLGRFPDSAELLYVQASVYVAQKKVPAATYALQKAIKLEPENPKYNYKLAEMMFLRGNVDRAELILEPFLEADEVMDDMVFLNAQILFVTERERQGMRQIEKILKKDPDNLKAKEALLAMLLQHSMKEAKAGRVSRAVRMLEDADEIVPGEKKILMGLALLEDEQGNGAEAMAYCERILEADPEDIKTLLLLGRMQRKEGLADEAEVTFREGLALAEEKGDRELVAAFEKSLNPFE
ncbi:tetratricopeptide repeat protein [Pelagicoccus mobilis]|uniref:Tetratricopeptide repeat protein n=1 Tax=Pelagicoccus mobilis TaxID=415221 RepID=A0A934RZK3_9BACT|nr:tetratricopeptide repeat protein [Pelagicoccus mobilis]MBK1879632.1 tetratricopeptide repeat protein [Pelagicoccus mobilis]